MVTILERPEGHILESTANTATVSESYGAGDAQFVSPTVHGLVDGDFIYAESNIENYAGFWYVDAITTGIFKIKQYANGDYVQFIADGSITWYKSTLAHGWSCVHLPITYRISTDLYPVNESDASVDVSSVQDANGYTVILLSGSLGSGVNSYDFVKLTLPSDTELSGVYQILEFISPTVMIINLEYDSGNNFTGATALKHYNNYNFIVRVYAGINASHQWVAQKPYELAATLQLIPDENNEAFFSINEILKSYIETRNNLTLGTLPNNIDFWTNFYIETAESYDDSDGYAFGTFTSNYTSDLANFEGTAVNAKLEFKNLYSGYLSEYLMTNSTAKFLTLFTIPVLFSCGEDTPECYSDISFMIEDSTGVVVNLDYYTGGSLSSTTQESLNESGAGVYRVPISPDCSYDEVRVKLTRGSALLNGTFTNTLSPWTNTGSGDEQWAYLSDAANINFELGLTLQNSYYLTQDFNTYTGTVYTVDIDALLSTLGGFGFAGNLVVYFSNGTLRDQVFISAFDEGSVGQIGGEVEFTALNDYSKIEIYVEFTSNDDGANVTIDVNSISLEWDDLSETKQFKIDCGCSNQEIRLSWLTNLPAFDNWVFTAKKDHIVEIQEAMVTKKNILPTWPKSYGAQADTIKKQTLRVTNKAYTVRSQFLTEAEADAISYIKSSVLVQIVNSRTNRRTVIVDTDSFIIRKDGDKTFEVAFNISFTDDIAVQTV